ncbi:MAG: hypothetical protein QG561_968 [Patescibacteria group bacterium]|nr:hypothetical protein [Patescibacteria group bacterium]
MKLNISIIICLFLGIVSGCTYIPMQSPNPIIMEDKGNSMQSTGNSIFPVVPLTPFIARGTEPFWSLVQTSTGVKFSRPDNSSGMILETWYTSVQTNSGTNILISGTPITPDLPIGATLIPGACSDGMSETPYVYTISVSYGTGILSGCAN